MLVTVAIPVCNGGALLGEVLSAVREQRSAELLVCDSASTDGSAELAERYGARVLRISRAEFSHGGTRNLLMSEARGDYVAFLTQDATPASPDWLSGLLGGFGHAEEVGCVFGPYVPRPGASVMVARELEDHFASLAVDGGPRIDRLSDAERGLPAAALYGPRAYFTDANACVSRAAWERVPFREIPYAEDHMLALDMLSAGYAKVYAPDAAVLHSHEYTLAGWFQRAFDEARAVRDIYGAVGPASPQGLARRVAPLVRRDVRRGGFSVAPASLAHHSARALGTAFGGRARALPPALTRGFSLEGRAG